MHASISRFGHLAFEETVLMAKTNHFSSIAIMLTDQHKKLSNRPKTLSNSQNWSSYSQIPIPLSKKK